MLDSGFMPLLCYNSLMNLANKLTLFRIFLIPLLILVWMFPYGYFDIHFYEFEIGVFSLSSLNLIILIIFLIASITDFLDGYIARKYNLITTFGKFADPIADKLLVNTIYILMLAKNMIPAIPIILMLSRDMVVDGCRMIASKNGIVVAADNLGKIKTVLQMISIVLILLNNIPFNFYDLRVDIFLLWLATFISFFSGLRYFMQMKEFIFESI